MMTEAREDRDYWNDKYSDEPQCSKCGNDLTTLDVEMDDGMCEDCWGEENDDYEVDETEPEENDCRD